MNTFFEKREYLLFNINFLYETLLFIFSYLLGSTSFGLLIGKIFYKTDIREHGSKNTGTTNSWRVLGRNAGIGVFLLDFAKGAIPILLARHLDMDLHPIIFGAAAIIGHVYPIYHQFKGGKAVATAAGVAFAYNPLFLLINFPLVFFTVLYLTSMVSLASIVTVTVALILSFFTKDLFFIILVIGVWLLIVFRHKDNIQRIRDRNENMIPWGLGFKRKNK